MTATDTAPTGTAWTGVVFRRLTPADAQAWCELTITRRQASPAGTFGDQALPPHDIDVTHLTLEPRHGSTFGVEIAGRLIGCARVRATDGGTWTLSTVYLDPAERHRGLGRLLVNAAIGAVPPDPPVELWVAADNPSATALYERVGFKRTGLTWAPDPDAWTHMRLLRR